MKIISRYTMVLDFKDRLTTSNWEGCIPVQLELSSTSLSSPTPPIYQHVLVPRHSYLHLSLETALKRLYPYSVQRIRIKPRRNDDSSAPAGTKNERPGNNSTSLQIQEPDSSDDEATERQKSELSATTDAVTKNVVDAADVQIQGEDSFSVFDCWFEDVDKNIPLHWHHFAGVLYDNHHHFSSPRPLPWKLRVYFQDPPEVLLPMMENTNSVQFMYKHSVKQAVTIYFGNNKKALSMTKQTHEDLWNSLVSKNDVGTFQQACERIFNEVVPNPEIPVRLILSSPPHKGEPSPPPRTLAGDPSSTVKDFLESHMGGWNDDHCKICVAGISVPSSSILQDLYRSLYHPDFFLYIIVKQQ